MFSVSTVRLPVSVQVERTFRTPVVVVGGSVEIFWKMSTVVDTPAVNIFVPELSIEVGVVSVVRAASTSPTV